MAHAQRGRMLYRQEQNPEEFPFTEEGRFANEVQGYRDAYKSTPLSSQRGAAMFDTGVGPAEQSYSDELAKAEPQYKRPAKATGAKKVFGNILSSLRGTQHIGDRMLYGDVPEAKEDFNLEVGERTRRLGSMGKAADLEARRRTAANTALYRGADLNVKFARNTREESLLPRRMRLLDAQIGKEGQQADASKALAEQRRRPQAARSPFRTFSPGQGIYDTSSGKVSQHADPAQARAARPAPRPGSGRGGAGGGATPYQLAQVEKTKTQRLLTHKKERDKRQFQIEADNAGMNPTLPDGSPNRMYTRDNDLAELGKWDEQQKEMIQRGYLAELDRLGQNVDLGLDEEDDPDMSGDSGSDGLEAGAMDDDEPVEIGDEFEDPSTGEVVVWDGKQWVRRQQ